MGIKWDGEIGRIMIKQLFLMYRKRFLFSNYLTPQEVTVISYIRSLWWSAMPQYSTTGDVIQNPKLMCFNLLLFKKSLVNTKLSDSSTALHWRAWVRKAETIHWEFLKRISVEIQINWFPTMSKLWKKAYI